MARSLKTTFCKVTSGTHDAQTFHLKKAMSLTTNTSSNSTTPVFEQSFDFLNFHIIIIIIHVSFYKLDYKAMLI